MIKKATIIFMVGFLCLAFIGCSGSSETVEPKQGVTEEVAEESEEKGDPATTKTNQYEDIIEEQTAIIEEQQDKLEEKDEAIEELKRQLSVAKSNLMAVEEELNSTISEEPEPEEEIVEESVKEAKTDNPEETDGATLGEKNAARSALDYLAYAPFSYNGLIEQLKFEGYTQEEAVYGVGRCGADWNKQAALMAEDYLNYSSFSRTELIAQLEFEGFTPQQAEYGAQAVGY